jgi:hypothetical protein
VPQASRQQLPPVQVPFITNAGHVDAEVAFYATTFGGTVFVASDGRIVYDLPDAERTTSTTLVERPVGARAAAVRGVERSPTVVSILKGQPDDWRTGLQTYDAISLGTAWDGIELQLRARANNVEKFFFVAPHADVADIRMAVDGASGLSLTEAGELQVETEAGPISFSRPVAYQERGGVRRDVDVAYALTGDRYGFIVGAYDRDEPLVIDPTLASTFVGGAGTQYVGAMTFDAAGDVIIAGPTNAADFPLGGTYRGGTNDVFVARLDANLTTMTAAAYVGGSADEAFGGLALDSRGDVFVSGKTLSNDIPVTSGAYDSTRNPGGTGADLFVAKLSPGLNTVLAATYIGGSRDEYWCCGSTLRIDGNDNVFTITLSSSADYPTTVGAYDRTYNDSDTDDVVISKFNNTLTSLLASTYLGGSLWDVPYGSALDADGNVYVVGRTSSSNFPITPGALHGDYPDGWSSAGAYYDGFVAKLNDSLSTLVASTYLGTTADLDILWDIAIAPDRSVYVVGSTISNAFPVTTGAYDTTFNGGGEDGVVTHLDAAFSRVLQSTYFGTAGFERTIGLALDAAGNVHVGGYTNSADLPVTADAFQPTYHAGGTGGWDGFHARLSGDLSTRHYATYIGGSADDVAYRPVLNAAGELPHQHGRLGPHSQRWHGRVRPAVADHGPLGREVGRRRFRRCGPSDQLHADRHQSRTGKRERDLGDRRAAGRPYVRIRDAEPGRLRGNVDSHVRPRRARGVGFRDGHAGRHPNRERHDHEHGQPVLGRLRRQHRQQPGERRRRGPGRCRRRRRGRHRRQLPRRSQHRSGGR